jgi:hypothetical protein
MGALLVGCGAVATAIGAWRSYVVAREALAPLVDGGDPTRSAIEATRPIFARTRIRLLIRRIAISVAWLAVAMYGLYLVVAGGALAS